MIRAYRLGLFVLCAAGCDNGLVSTPTTLVAMPAATALTLGSEVGCNDDLGAVCVGDRAPHQVSISAFMIDKTEVTRLQYQECIDKLVCPRANADPFNSDDQDLPVLIDDPDAAARYCEWRGRRLPTEAEFEYAARWHDGALHDYPWGDTVPDCSQVNHRGCGAGSSGSLGKVGSHPFDANGAGVLDLAGSVPEWVADGYRAHSGCVDRLGFGDLCGDDANCAEARCAAAGDACLRGCLPDQAENGDGALGHEVSAGPSCVLAPPAALPALDPVDGAQAQFHVVRGGGPLDRACVLLGHARRHAQTAMGFRAGFRCVASTRAPLAPATYRFSLASCPSPDYLVEIAIATTDGKPFAHELDEWPHGAGAVAVFQPGDGTTAHRPCGDLFVVRPRDAGDFTVTVRDYQGCLGWQRSVQIPGGGDVPASGVDALEPAGHDESTCTVPHGAGSCAGGPCHASCSADWFRLHGPDTGRRDCDGLFLDGCEVDVMNDARNCGGCGMACESASQASVACLAGHCAIAACNAGWSDCDQTLANGCEIDVRSDARNCGACRSVCSANHIASPICSGGACHGSCDPGWGDCDGDKLSNGCETSLRTTMNCGACGTACDQGMSCVDGACQ